MKNKFKDKRSLTGTNVALVASLSDLVPEWFQLTLANKLDLGFRGDQSRSNALTICEILSEDLKQHRPSALFCWTVYQAIEPPIKCLAKEINELLSANPTDFSIFSVWFPSIWRFSRRSLGLTEMCENDIHQKDPSALYIDAIHRAFGGS